MLASEQGSMDGNAAISNHQAMVTAFILGGTGQIGLTGAKRRQGKVYFTT
jgi:hypothetical protein